MPVLDPSAYDISYFDGWDTEYMHNAGYSLYKRWSLSGGEHWHNYANRLATQNVLAGKKVLEIGCAKGFVVEDLRALGIDAYGLDVSSYAIGEASPAVAPYLTVGDARTALAAYRRNEFDVVFSLRFLECISDADLPGLISEMNRISRDQFHVIDTFPAGGSVTNYYNVHTLAEWQAMDFDVGTRLVMHEDETQELIK